MPLYQAEVAQAHPLIIPSHPPIVPPHPQVPFQEIPQILIIAQSIATMEPSIFQNIVLKGC